MICCLNDIQKYYISFGREREKITERKGETERKNEVCAETE